MSKIAIVTDSSAYIPSELSKGLPIYVVPLHVLWEGRSYSDFVDLQPAEFYNRLEKATEMPQTSQATPGDFLASYRSLLEKGYEILSIHISSRVTKTLESAVLAKSMLKGARIELVDSLTGSMAMGFHVLQAAKAAMQGATLQACKVVAEKARDHTHIYFVPGTLEFLHRGGRIGSAQAFFGSMIKIFPILEVKDGVIEAVERVRTFNKATGRMIELMANKIGDRSPVHLASLHSNCLDKAQELLELARQKLGAERITESVISDISPAVGAHIGPGAVGLAYLEGM
jgi:DegV family protein with EDD domain